MLSHKDFRSFGMFAQLKWGLSDQNKRMHLALNATVSTGRPAHPVNLSQSAAAQYSCLPAGCDWFILTTTPPSGVDITELTDLGSCRGYMLALCSQCHIQPPLQAFQFCSYTPGPPLPGSAGRGPESANPPTRGGGASLPSLRPSQQGTLHAEWSTPVETWDMVKSGVIFTNDKNLNPLKRQTKSLQKNDRLQSSLLNFLSKSNQDIGRWITRRKL